MVLLPEVQMSAVIATIGSVLIIVCFLVPRKHHKPLSNCQIFNDLFSLNASFSVFPAIFFGVFAVFRKGFFAVFRNLGCCAVQEVSALVCRKAGAADSK